jgi:hypothetical protein
MNCDSPYFLLFIHIQIYNNDNIMKTKKFSTKKCFNTKEQLSLFLTSLKEINNWSDRIKFTKKLINTCSWSEELNNSKKIRKIKFVYMDYNPTRAGFWGPFRTDIFHNPKKIIGLIRAIAKLKSKSLDSFVHL